MRRDSNVGPDEGVREAVWETYWMLEQMPTRLRQLLASAPYDYAVRPYWEAFAAHAHLLIPEEIERQWAANMVADRRAAALSLYGQDHPQAG